MSTFTCPHCNGLIQVVGADAGVDATGAQVSGHADFMPFSTEGMPTAGGAFAPAFYAGLPGRVYPVKMPNGQTINVPGGTLLSAYRKNDGSLSDMFKRQFPYVPCTNQ